METLAPLPARRGPATPTSPAEFAWRVHAAQEAWTTKVDVKASVLLAFDGGVSVIALSNQNWLAQNLSAWTWYRVGGLTGFALLILAVAAAVAAILPRLGPVADLRQEYAENTVYFGHLRFWRPDRLADRFTTMSGDDEVAMLAREIAKLSRLNWFKHRSVQVSVLLTVFSVVLLTATAAATALA